MGPERSLWVIHRALCNGALIPVYTESTSSFPSTTLNTRRIPWFLDLGIELQLNYREQSICLDTLRGEIGEHYLPRVKDSRSTSRLSVNTELSPECSELASSQILYQLIPGVWGCLLLSVHKGFSHSAALAHKDPVSHTPARYSILDTQSRMQ